MDFRGQIITGARVKLALDGVKVALCVECSFGEEIQNEGVAPIDQYEMAEYVDTGYIVTFNARIVRVRGSAIKNRDGVRIFPRLKDILGRGEMTGTIEDQTGTVIASIQRVKTSRYQCRIGKMVTMNDVDFTAIAIKDESEIV